MPRHTRHRADGTHWEILAGLKKVTYAEDVHNGSLGMDILSKHVVTKAPVFLEVKPNAKAKLTGKEEAMRDMFPGHWRRVNTLDEALQAVGINPWPNRLQPGQGGPVLMDPGELTMLSPAARRVKRLGSP